MLTLLADAKARGLSFDEAWDWAWSETIWPSDTEHRREWRASLRWTKKEWKAAFENRATPSARRVSVWKSSMARDELDEDLQGSVAA